MSAFSGLVRSVVQIETKEGEGGRGKAEVPGGSEKEEVIKKKRQVRKEIGEGRRERGSCIVIEKMENQANRSRFRTWWRVRVGIDLEPLVHVQTLDLIVTCIDT